MTTQRDSKGQFQLDSGKTVLILTEYTLRPMAAKQAENQITLLVQQILE
ncbi:hypothetical protein [Rosenbergiella nectarea]|nr:hypothetical protein [Rosenbergiella nectarea]